MVCTEKSAQAVRFLSGTRVTNTDVFPNTFALEFWLKFPERRRFEKSKTSNTPISSRPNRPQAQTDLRWSIILTATPRNTFKGWLLFF
jgi:hypothetical protein